MTASLPPVGGAADRWVRREPLAGDASSRRYWRLTDRRGRTAILADQAMPNGGSVLHLRYLEGGWGQMPPNVATLAYPKPIPPRTT